MEFGSEGEFEQWLEKQSQEVCVAIATRAAVRLWPLLLGHQSWKDTEEAKKAQEKLVLLIGWAMVISSVAVAVPIDELQGAAYIARAAYSARAVRIASTVYADRAIYGDNASSAANSAAYSAVYAARASSETDGAATCAGYAAHTTGYAAFAAYADAENPERLLRRTLWKEKGPPEGLRPEDIGPTLLDTDPRFEFFRRWYEGIVRGEPLPLELCRRVATQISRETWESGADQVAEAIARIEAEWLAEQLPQAEEIRQDPSDGRYTVSPIVFDPDDMIDRLFKQLRFALDMALRGHNQSGFNEMCVAFRYLEHTLEECRDDPNAVHMHLRLAREIIEANLKSGVYRQEDGLTALVFSMARHEVQLRADHPVVRVAHDRFVAQKVTDLDDERRLKIAEEFRKMQTPTKERLAQEYGLDADTLESDSGAEAQADAIKRSGGRSAKIAADLMERSGEAVKAVDGSAANKGLGRIMRLQKLIDLISPLL